MPLYKWKYFFTFSSSKPTELHTRNLQMACNWNLSTQNYLQYKSHHSQYMWINDENDELLIKEMDIL